MESSWSLLEPADFFSSVSIFGAASLDVWFPVALVAPAVKLSAFEVSAKDPVTASYPSSGLATPSASKAFFIFFRSFFFCCLLMPVVSISASSVDFFGCVDPANRVPSLVTSCVLTVLFIVEI